MSATVALPVWLVVLVGVLAAWAALDRLLIPSVRWFIRRRVDRVIEDVSTRLRLELRPFSLTKRQVLIDRLVYDSAVIAAVEEHAAAEGMPRQVAMDEVERYAREIVPAFNAYFYFRIGYWLARRLAQTIYRVRIGYADQEALLAVPRDATVVFVMNHRSNMDYVLVAYLAADQTALSYAVGEWARIWPLQQLIRAMGAYFVRRRSRNRLYRRVLERYVQMATEGGVTQAMFPEGGLSRDGRLGPAKLGLLDYLTNAFDPEGPHDLVFLPVGLNYDRVLEDRTLLRSLQPEAPRRGPGYAAATTLRFLLHNLRLMVTGRWYRFGYAAVNFGTPVSLREWLATHELDLRGLPREARFQAVQHLADSLMRSVGGIVPVTPVALVARTLSEHPERSWSELEIKAAAHALMRALSAAGAHVYVPRHQEDYAVGVGLRMLTLRRMVRQEADGRLRLDPASLDLVRYYANSIAQLAPEEAEGEAA